MSLGPFNHKRGTQTLIGGPQGPNLAIPILRWGSDRGVHLVHEQGAVRVWGTPVVGQQSACGQPVTHPVVQVVVAEGVVPLPRAQHHHAVLALVLVVGFPGPPVAGAEDFGSEDGAGGCSLTAFSLDAPL